MRSQTEVRDDVLSRAGRYRVVHPKCDDPEAPSPLKVKEVWVESHRYIVCLNEDEARKDAADREAIVAALRDSLRSGDKSLVGNKGYRRFLSGSKSHQFQVDEAKVTEDARYDGKWVLRTNTDMDAAETALQYKQLWTVEHWFRSCKSLVRTRPIYHKLDETIEVLSIFVDGEFQAASGFFTPSSKMTPAITSFKISEPFNERQLFDALSISL